MEPPTLREVLPMLSGLYEAMLSGAYLRAYVKSDF